MQRAQSADAAVQRKQPERNERLQACHHRQVTTGRAARERGRSRCRDSRGKRRRRLGIHPAGSQLWPFLTYADSRDLRRELYMAYNTKCTHDNASNNLEIVKKLANVRMEIAQLLGYDNFAEYNLQERMAQNSESVYKLLDQLLEAYTPTAKQEYAEVQALARQAEGEDFVLMPWDWAYYSHKLKDRKFNIDDELLRPYFELNNVKQGVFGLATRLYGITFKKNPDIPVYHKDVDAYEVFDKDGKFLAVFYTDFHPRAGKRSGAWMTSYKEQWIDEKDR